MNWVLIAIVSGLLTTGQYSSEEACLGKKAMIEKDKVTNVKCIDMQPQMISGGIMLCANNVVCR